MEQLALYDLCCLGEKESSDVISDEELHLTSSNHNEAAADEYAAVAEYEAAPPPSYTESLEMHQLPATSSSFSDHPLTDNDSCCVSIQETTDIIQPGHDPCPSDNENVQQHDTASTHGIASLPLPAILPQYRPPRKRSPQVEYATQLATQRPASLTWLEWFNGDGCMCCKACKDCVVIILCFAKIIGFFVGLIWYFS